MALPNGNVGVVNGRTQYRTGSYWKTTSQSTSLAPIRQWLQFDDETDQFGYYNYPGTPEGNVAANIGSWCSDTTTGNIYVKTTDTVTTGWKLLEQAREDLHTAKFIVSSEGTTGTGANFTTISAAIAAAQGTGINSTIFIMPGSTGIYTENFTLPANINLTAFQCDAQTPNVTIKGKITCTDAGSRSISGIRLQTNSDFALVVSGAAATVVNLNNCFINAANNTAISYSSASASSAINIRYCTGNIATTGIACFAHSSAGNLLIEYSEIQNSGGSSTASTASAGTLQILHTLIGFPITTSGTNSIGSHMSLFEPAIFGGVAATAITYGGSGGQTSLCDSFNSSTASAISISSSLQIHNAIIASSNTNAITGAGSIAHNGLSFTSGSNATINSTLTQSVLQYNNTIPRTATSTTPYTVLSTDYFISVDASGGAKQVNLPNAPSLNQVFIVKDRNGNALANNITVTTPGGVVNIDGATTFVMNINYGSSQFIWNGTKYESF